jgi:hypothetical protein
VAGWCLTANGGCVWTDHANGACWLCSLARRLLLLRADTSHQLGAGVFAVSMRTLRVTCLPSLTCRQVAVELWRAVSDAWSISGAVGRVGLRWGAVGLQRQLVVGCAGAGEVGNDVASPGMSSFPVLFRLL